MIQPYSTTDILLARIETLLAIRSLNLTREEAARIVAETWGKADRPPGA